MPMDRSRYPPNWEDISNYVRFTLAMGKCELCGAEHGKPHPETGSRVVLTTAHWDHDTTNNDYENLVALCQRCHLAHDLDEHLRHAAQTRRKKKIAAGQLVMF